MKGDVMAVPVSEAKPKAKEKPNPSRKGARIESAKPAEKEAKPDRLKTLVEVNLKEIEASIRKFQTAVAAINSDAGYEVKRAADYFLEDARGGIEDVIAKMQSTNNYQPNEFAAAVMDGDYEDVPLIGNEPSTEPSGTLTNQHLEVTEALATGPVAPRSNKKVRH